MVTQLERLAKPFPDRLIHSNPSGGGSYVKHSVVTEKLLAVLGPFSFELVEVIRGHVDGAEPNPSGKSERAKRGTPALESAIVGAVCRLSVVVDGVPVRVEEVGDCEQPHNWPHDGARLKDAMSDSLKRAAMRLGVTLHLWSGPEFSLYDQLRQENANKGAGDDSADRGGDAAIAGSDGANSHDVGRPADEPAPIISHEGSAKAGSSSSTRTQGDDGLAQIASKNRLGQLQAKLKMMQGTGFKVDGHRRAAGLPLLNQDCTPDELERWAALLNQHDTDLTRVPV